MKSKWNTRETVAGPRLKRGVNTKPDLLSNVIFRRFQVVEIFLQSV
tara:strand:+ start:243 stop:380 length:138 start_codon:yes stop_codon:yes gene_type:complete